MLGVGLCLKHHILRAWRLDCLVREDEASVVPADERCSVGGLAKKMGEGRTPRPRSRQFLRQALVCLHVQLYP